MHLGFTRIFPFCLSLVSLILKDEWSLEIQMLQGLYVLHTIFRKFKFCIHSKILFMVKIFLMSFLKQAMNLLVKPMRKVLIYQAPRSLHHLHFHGCSDDEIEQRFIDFFNRPDIDGWDVRQGMNDLVGYDFVPRPEVISAALYACRRVNDYAIAIRFLESVKDNCGSYEKEIYPWIIQEIQPVLKELGVDTPEQLGYDRPELYLESVYDIH